MVTNSNSADISIHIKGAENSDITQDIKLSNTVRRNLQIDFDVNEIQLDHFSITVRTSRTVYGEYETFYAIGPDSTTEGT